MADAMEGHTSNGMFGFYLSVRGVSDLLRSFFIISSRALLNGSLKLPRHTDRKGSIALLRGESGSNSTGRFKFRDRFFLGSEWN